MSMTQRDYKVLAHALHHAQDQAITESERIGVSITRQNVTEALHNNNTNFNRERFTAVARGEERCEVCLGILR